MSINITGPAKYRFQDLVSLMIALANAEIKSMEGFVELNTSFEDLELRMDEREFAIQIKGTEKYFDMNMLASWLAHFGDKQSEQCLFDRLLSGTRVVIVTSSRAKDSILPFRKSKGSILRPHSKHIKKSAVNELVEAIATCEISGKKTEALFKNRKLHCGKYKNHNIDRKHFKNLVIVDLVNEESVKTDIRKILTGKFKVPFERLDSLILSLLDIVQKSATTKENFIKKLLEEITKSSQISRVAGKYILRGDEENLIAQLKRYQVLLLTGHSRCGKSMTSEYIADHLKRKGYYTKIGNDITEAMSFLQASSDRRLFILDDPFGNRGLVSGGHELLNKLRRLCTIDNGNLLIVVQSKDELLQVAGAGSIDEIQVSQYRWIQIDDYNKEMNLKVWHQVANERNIPQELSTLVEDLIGNEKKLSLGAIEVLAYSYESLKNKFTKESVLKLANRDAATLGMSLVNEYKFPMEKLLLTLALSTEDQIPISFDDLAFLVSGSSDTPSKKSDKGYFRESQYPVYKEDYNLQSYNELLSVLEKRRLIEINNDEVQFRHSFYRFAAEGVLNKLTHFQVNEVNETLRRGIFSVNPKTAYASSRNIRWLINIFPLKDKNKLIDLLFDGISSVFPSVKESCYLELIKQESSLTKNQLSKLEKLSEYVHTRAYDLSWHNETPWIANKNFDIEDILNIKREQHNINELLVLINEGYVSEISMKSILELVKYFNYHPQNLTLDVAKKMYDSPISAIRALVATAWLKFPRTNDERFLVSIFNDSIPFVINEAFGGVDYSWRSLSVDRQIRMIDLLQESIESSFSAGLIIDDLIIFDRDKEIVNWGLFARLFPIALNKVGILSGFNKARMNGILHTAQLHLSDKEMFNICKAWSSSLLSLKENVLDDYEAGIMDYVFVEDLSPDDFLERNNIIRRLLEITNTPILMIFISDLISNWQKVNDETKQTIINLFKINRKDAIWLKAIAITRKNVPAEIQEAIFGNPTFFKQSTKAFINNIDRDLLKASLQCHIGEPQPLYYIGKHHSSDYWNSIINDLSLSTGDEFFHMAFSDILSKGNDDEIQNVIINSGYENIENVLELMIDHRMRVNGDFLPKSWDALLKNLTSLKKENLFFNAYKENAASMIDGFDDLKDWILDNDISYRMFEMIEPDATLIKNIHVLIKSFKGAIETFEIDEDSTKIVFYNTIIALLNDRESEKIQFFRTLDLISNMLSTSKLNNEDIKIKIKSLRDAHFDTIKYKSLRRTMEITDWNWKKN